MAENSQFKCKNYHFVAKNDFFDHEMTMFGHAMTNLDENNHKIMKNGHFLGKNCWFWWKLTDFDTESCFLWGTELEDKLLLHNFWAFWNQKMKNNNLGGQSATKQKNRSGNSMKIHMKTGPRPQLPLRYPKNKIFIFFFHFINFLQNTKKIKKIETRTLKKNRTFFDVHSQKYNF